MAVSVVQSTYGVPGGGSTNTYSFAASSSANLLVVDAHLRQDIGSSARYENMRAGTVSMTQRDARETGRDRVERWYLLNPPTTGVIAAHRIGGAGSYLWTARTFAGVATSSPFAAAYAGVNAAASTSWSYNISASSDQMTIDALQITGTPGSTFTKRNASFVIDMEHSTATPWSVAGHLLGATSGGYSWVTARGYAFIADVLRASAAAATSGPAASTGAVSASIDAIKQYRPEGPTITGHSRTGNTVTLKITPSTEGYPARWYIRLHAATTYNLDGQSTVGTTAWVYYYLNPVTNYDIACSHYNSTGRIESLWDTTATSTSVSTIGARRVSGQQVNR